MEHSVKSFTVNHWNQILFYENLSHKRTIEEKETFIISELCRLRNSEDDYTGKSPEVRKAMLYLQEHFSEEISLGDMASLVGLSENYFSNLFKLETGMNLTYYINTLRINQAKQLLDSTNMKVYEVAEAVGYHNAAYFSTMFRKITRISVSEYRRNESVNCKRNR